MLVDHFLVDHFLPPHFPACGWTVKEQQQTDELISLLFPPVIMFLLSICALLAPSAAYSFGNLSAAVQGITRG